MPPRVYLLNVQVYINQYGLNTTFVPSEPSAPPQTVRAVNKTMHSVGVTWKEVPEGHRHGEILSYTVSYHSAKPGDPMQVKSVRTPTRFATLTNLIRDTNYSITVMASNQVGNGPASSPTFVITSNGSKFYFLLTYTARSTERLSQKWTSPQYCKLIPENKLLSEYYSEPNYS